MSANLPGPPSLRYCTTGQFGLLAILTILSRDGHLAPRMQMESPQQELVSQMILCDREKRKRVAG